MITIEIKNKIDKNKMKMVMDVLKALGVKAVIHENKDDTELTRKEFVNKIDRARKSPKTKVFISEQSEILGI